MSYVQRRTFRGRAGPTDGNLPKYNARRRKHAQRKPPSVDVSLNSSGSGAASSIDARIIYQVDDDSESAIVIQKSEADSKEEESEVLTPDNPEADWSQELAHLRRRMANNRRALSQSSSLSDPLAYKTNVLNATRNCVVEWKSILNRYHDISEKETLQTGLELFGLVQQSLQSGPLQGAKPGYFKRCGSDISSDVLEFLVSCFPTESDARALHFSEKQTKAIADWTRNASTAAATTKAPSKSLLKKQSLARKKRDSKKGKIVKSP